MMIKVFTLNSNGKIEITEEELRKLLDASYWEGYYDNGKSWTYTSPNINPITNPSITFTTCGENNAK